MTNDELVARYFLSRLLWWRHDLDKLDDEAIAQLVTVLLSLKRDIFQRLMDEAEGIASITDWGHERLQAVENWADEVLAGASTSVAATMTESSLLAAASSLAAHNATLSFDGRASAIRTVGMTPQQLRSWFQQTPLGGGLLKEWVDRAFANGIKASLLTSLQKSGVEGKGTAESVRRLMQSALDDGFNITRREAVTLTRTYIQTANVQAMDAVCAANEQVIKGYKRVETLDNKTCRLCAAADGMVYGVREQRPPLPAHANCRGIWVPVAKTWKDFGIDLPELEDVARPWVMREPGPIGAGGRKIEEYGSTKEDFKGWWFSLDEKQQLKTSIGPVRRKLLLSGAIRWEDMIERETGRLRLLEELGFDQEGKALKRAGGVKGEGNGVGEWLDSVVTRAVAGDFRATGERRVVGRIGENVVDFLKRRNIALETLEISVSDKDLFHALRTAKKYALPESIWKRLPDILKKPEAIYWDSQKPGLIFALREPEGTGKIILLINKADRENRKGLIVNKPRSGRILNDLREFENVKRYTKVI